MGIATAQASPLPMDIEQSPSPLPASEETPPPSPTSASLNTTDSSEKIAQTYPIDGTVIQDGISLTGPGGHSILNIKHKGTSVKILEERDEHYRVICIQCDPNRPFQAGFLLKEDVQITK